MSNGTQTVSLSNFLLARIAEDEAGAADEADFLRPGQSRRFLAEAEMKRQVMALHRPSTDSPGPEFRPYCEGCWEEGGMDGAPTYPCRTVRIVAAVYANHPDYRDEWRR